MTNLHEISIKKIDGSDLDWQKFASKKILIVNTASECGFTHQYAQMQELYDLYKDKLEIIGVPCNDFGHQEPGSNSDIVQFCSKNYGVSFTVTEKVSIAHNPHPLFVWLMNPAHGDKTSKVEWNFHKYLLDQNGDLIKSFPSSVSPIDERILELL